IALLGAAKRAAAGASGQRAEAQPAAWLVVDGALPQASAPVGAVLVRHGGTDHPVALHLQADALFALSLRPLPTSSSGPRPAMA
ncbi:MAG: hypothetical protein ACT6T0_14285, partial [Nevskia sp.]|uniref:hypothetical protein n=1 Tax=Nevskia sp. TaxID=1929292 RepID=UPI00403627EA